MTITEITLLQPFRYIDILGTNSLHGGEFLGTVVPAPGGGSSSPTSADVESKLSDLKATLEAYVASSAADETGRKNAQQLLVWLEKKVGLISGQDAFVAPTDPKKVVQRSTVCWINFGFNIGREFRGRHPGIILRRTKDMVFAVPLSSQEPTAEQLAQGIYVEVDKVHGFKPMRRWVNVLNIVPISLLRIDFDANFGHVKGPVLDEIGKAIGTHGVR